MYFYFESILIHSHNPDSHIGKKYLDLDIHVVKNNVKCHHHSFCVEPMLKRPVSLYHLNLPSESTPPLWVLVPMLRTALLMYVTPFKFSIYYLDLILERAVCSLSLNTISKPSCNKLFITKDPFLNGFSTHKFLDLLCKVYLLKKPTDPQ